MLLETKNSNLKLIEKRKNTHLLSISTAVLSSNSGRSDFQKEDKKSLMKGRYEKLINYI